MAGSVLFGRGMVICTPEIEALVPKIIGCAIAVHRAFGPGLLESIYRDCLLVELKAAGFSVRSEQYVPLMFRGERVAADLKLDLIVENSVIIEVNPSSGCIPYTSLR